MPSPEAHLRARPRGRRPAPALGAASQPTPDERDRLLQEHLVTVRFIARKVHQTLPRHVELDDLILAGMVGLMEACNRFDARRHVQFKELRPVPHPWRHPPGLAAHPRLGPARTPPQGARHCRDHTHSRPASRPRPRRAGNRRGHADELEEPQQFIGELHRELGSLNAEHSKDEDDEELEYVPASPEEDPLFLCLAAESRQRLIDAIEELPEKERLVLTLYYYEELTMREIGLTLGVVESRVSQIHSGAVRRLRMVLGQTTRRSNETQPATIRSRSRRSRSTAA